MGFASRPTPDKSDNFIYCKLILYQTQVGKRLFHRLHARYATASSYNGAFSRQSEQIAEENVVSHETDKKNTKSIPDFDYRITDQSKETGPSRAKPPIRIHYGELHHKYNGSNIRGPEHLWI
jgi:hypothetical protein